jgi:hypothetical protein
MTLLWRHQLLLQLTVSGGSFCVVVPTTDGERKKDLVPEIPLID